jgi:hypothetical protein
MEINSVDLLKGSAVVMAMSGLLGISYALSGGDRLPSWYDRPAKTAIVNFIKITKASSDPVRFRRTDPLVSEERCRT